MKSTSELSKSFFFLGINVYMIVVNLLLSCLYTRVTDAWSVFVIGKQRKNQAGVPTPICPHVQRMHALLIFALPAFLVLTSKLNTVC